MYNCAMDVAVTELRAHLSEWIDRARAGEEVVVLERGVPVARLLGVAGGTTLDRLVAGGVIARPARTNRPKARGRARPTTQRAVAEYVSEQRR
jgi:prevent-host-death family protein